MGGNVHGMLEAFKTSREHLQKCFDLRPDARAHDLLGSSYQRLGYGHIWYGDVLAAIPLYRRAIELSEKAVAMEPLNSSYQRNLTLAYISLGDVLGSPFHINLGDIRAAVPFYTKAIDTASRMAEADPRNAQTRIMLNNSRTRFATTLLYSDPQRALAMYREALKAFDALVDADARNTVFRRDRGFTLLDIGIAYERLDDRDSALRYLRLALDQQQAVVFADTARTQFRQDLIPTHLAIARLDTSAAEARFHLERALELAEAQRAASPHNLYTARNHSDTLEALGDHFLDAGERRQAFRWFEKSALLWRDWEAAHPVSPYSSARRRRAERLVEATDREP
jgi:tetratricopeptide (TPR) repeat protein